MLVHEQGKESSLTSCQVRVVLRTLVQHDIGQLRLNLLNPSQVLLSEGKSLLGIILKLDGVFVSGKVLARAESTSDAGIALLFPATSVALNRRTVRVGLAGDFDPFCSTCTVDSELSFTKLTGAWLIRMAGSHALVTTLLLQLEAALATAILLELLKAGETATGWMADLLALVTTVEHFFADLSTIGNALMTEYTSHQLFATVAHTSHLLEAGGTVARVALH